VGIGGNEVLALFETITLDVGDFSYSLYAGFVNSPLPLALLGQNGFSDSFEVRFNLPKKVIELLPASS